MYLTPKQQKELDDLMAKFEAENAENAKEWPQEGDPLWVNCYDEVRAEGFVKDSHHGRVIAAGLTHPTKAKAERRLKRDAAEGALKRIQWNAGLDFEPKEEDWRSVICGWNYVKDEAMLDAGYESFRVESPFAFKDIEDSKTFAAIDGVKELLKEYFENIC